MFKNWIGTNSRPPTGMENISLNRSCKGIFIEIPQSGWLQCGKAVIFFSQMQGQTSKKSVLFLSCTSTKEAYFVTFSRQFLASTWQLSYLSRVRPLPVQNCVSMTDDVETLWYNPFTIYLHCIQYYSYLANLTLA